MFVNVLLLHICIFACTVTRTRRAKNDMSRRKKSTLFLLRAHNIIIVKHPVRPSRKSSRKYYFQYIHACTLSMATRKRNIIARLGVFVLLRKPGEILSARPLPPHHSAAFYRPPPRLRRRNRAGSAAAAAAVRYRKRVTDLG